MSFTVNNENEQSKHLGIFLHKLKYAVLAFDNDYSYLCILKPLDSIKFALSTQTVFFPNFKKNLLASSTTCLKKRTSTTIISKNAVVQIERNQHLSHVIVITDKDKEYKLQVLKRHEINELENIILQRYK